MNYKAEKNKTLRITDEVCVQMLCLCDCSVEMHTVILSGCRMQFGSLPGQNRSSIHFHYSEKEKKHKTLESENISTERLWVCAPSHGIRLTLIDGLLYAHLHKHTLARCFFTNFLILNE